LNTLGKARFGFDSYGMHKLSSPLGANVFHPLVFGVLGVLAAAPSAYSKDSSQVYSVTKTAIYVQSTSSGAVASSKYPYNFTAESPTAATLAIPGGASVPLPFTGGGGDYELYQSFTAKTGLDTAFPNGTYQMTGSGIPTLSFPLTTDSYPSAIPAVTNGTWSNGVLMIDPASADTIDFSDFTTYATAGVGGYMQINISDISNGGSNLKQSQLSVSNTLGITQSSTPFTTYSIPASTLNPGDIYEAKLDFETALKFDDTTVSGSGVVSIFSNELVFYIVAPQSGVTTPPPAIAANLTNQTGPIGGSASFSAHVNAGGSPITGSYVSLWYFNGLELNIDGVKYVDNGTSLTINNLADSDAGTYFAKFLNDGGLAISGNATLTVSAATAPVITTQPMSQSLNTGSTVVFTVAASGSPTSYQWQFSTNSGASWTNLGDGNGISGSAGPQLEIQNASAADNAEYACLVTSAGGSTQSNPAALTVAASSDPGYLINISARSFVGTGGNIMIGGFYIVGSTSRSVLIQAIGPGLAGEGVTGVLQHPALSIHNSSGATIYSNTGWGSSQLLLNAAAAAYANPVLQANSADSELLLTLPPGGYTAEISGADGGTGVALCAIYQLP
jgi:hypothetical protein